VRRDILDFYANSTAPNFVKKNAKAWQQVQSNSIPSDRCVGVSGLFREPQKGAARD
jgi:hypothetical protein